MNKLLIPVHSFVDLITNSSSEVYVEATDATIKGIKKLVNHLLQLTAPSPTAHVMLTADDLFDIDVVYTCYDANCREKLMTLAEITAQREVNEKAQEAIDLRLDTEALIEAQRKALKEERKTYDWEFKDDSEGYPQSQVRVIVKDKSNKDAVAAAKILSDLSGLFSIDAGYDG